VLASHTEIYEAIARRDGAAAKSAMERHIQELIEHSLRSFAGGEAGRNLTAEELLYSA
jgi:DNA-binding GntR family transcriptional regulator